MYRIMIVDDERSVRAGLIESVPWDEAECEEVTEADNGADALRKMEQSLPDVALVDLEMPVMDGMELIREIRRRGWPVDVVILTCHTDFACAQEAIRLDVFDYVLKLSASGRSILDTLRRVWMRRLRRQGAPRLLDEAQHAGPGQMLVLLADYQTNDCSGVYAIYRALIFREDRLKEPVKCFQTEGNGLAVLLSDRCAEASKKKAQQLLDCICRDTGRKITAGLSDVFESCDARTIAQAYMRAQRGFYEGHSRVYSDDKMTENWNDTSELVNPIDLLNMHRDDEEVFASIQEALPKLYGRKPEFVRICLVEWMYAMSVRARRKGCTMVEPMMNFKEISRRMEQLDSFDELRQEILCAIGALKEQEVALSLSDAVRLTTQIVRRHPEGSESLMEIARSIGCSYCYLSSQFKIEMGVGFSEFRNRLRIQKAMNMMKETERSIGEIAEMLGYSSPYYFSVAFKKITGVAPASWRSMNCGGEVETKHRNK